MLASHPLLPSHNRSCFDCGDDALNQYIQRFASQNARSGISQTRVWLKNNKVAGYYSLSMGSILRESLPATLVKRLPRYPLPIVRLSRIAVDLLYQGGNAPGCHYGSALLMDALFVCYQSAQNIGAVAVIVDAKNNRAKRYYIKNSFKPISDNAMTLYLPYKELVALFEI